RPVHQGLYRRRIPLENRGERRDLPVAERTDELDSRSSTLSRGDLLKRGGAAAFAVSMFGGLSDKALGFYGPLKFANKQLAGDLRIMTWAHFVPSYDQWLANTYIKKWGGGNAVGGKVNP